MSEAPPADPFLGGALLGPAEPDGAVPFVVAGPAVDDSCVVVAGLLVGGSGLREAEGARVAPADAQGLLDRSAGQHGLARVPLHVALHFGDRALREGGHATPALLAALWETVPEGVRTTAALTSPLRRLDKSLVPAFLAQCGPLIEDGGLLVFGVSQDALADVVPGLVDTLRGEADRDQRQAAIADAVAALSVASLDGPARARWGLALDVLSAAYPAGEAQRAARHTALALRDGLPGDRVPFVRIWVERALRSTVELALQLGGPRSLRERLAARGVPSGEA